MRAGWYMCSPQLRILAPLMDPTPGVPRRRLRTRALFPFTIHSSCLCALSESAPSGFPLVDPNPASARLVSRGQYLSREMTWISSS